MKQFLLGLFVFVGLLSAEQALLYYPLDEFEEKVIVNHGTAENGNAQGYLLHKDNLVPAVVGNGLHILGLADGLTLEDPDFFPENGFAISLYFRPDRLSERMTLACFSGTDSEQRLTALQIEDKHLVELDCVGHVVYPIPKNPRPEVKYVAGPELKVNQWYHLVWSMDGEHHRIWLDGELVLDEPSAIVPKQIKYFLIGNTFCFAVRQRDRFVGTIDEFRFMAKAPSEQEIRAAAALCAQGAPMPKIARTYDRVIGKDEKPIDAHIDPNTSEFVFNGQREPVMIYAGGGFLASAGYAFDTLPEATATGMSVFRTGAEGGREFCGGNWWYGMGKYDFEIVDRNLDIVFRENPDAKILLGLPSSPPAWWGYQFPDEQCQDNQGRIKHDYFASHSYSSQKWLRDLDEAWGAFFEHVKTKPYYNRIIGYVPTSGRYGECLRACYNSQLYGKEFTDYSPAEVAAYRAWLRKKYGDIETMKAAYGEGRAPESFETAGIPTPAERTRPDSFYFTNPVADRCNIDYMFFVNDQSAQAVIDFTNILRKYVGPNKIIGLYFGYMLEDALGLNRAWLSDSGHLALGRVLREAQVDFLCSPVGYYQRELGCVGPLMGAPSSLRLHHKMWLEEADIRTSLSSGKAEYSGASNLEESKAVLWRTHGNVVVNNDGVWWFPISGRGAYSHPEIWHDFGVMHKDLADTAKENVQDDRTKRIALVIDPYSNHFRRHSFYDQLTGNLLEASRDVFAKSAVGYDYYISDDLDLLPDDYPVYIFLNSFYMPAAQRKIIERRFKKDGKLLVFTYGAGLFNHARYSDRLNISTANVEDAIGMKCDWLVQKTTLDSQPLDGAPVKISPLSIKGTYNPAFIVTDEKATHLATYTAEELAGKTAVAFKDMGTWRSVFIGTPVFTEELIRSLAKLGGAHVYSEASNVVLRAGNGHILVHSGHDDTVNITLPEKAREIILVETGETLARDTDTLTVTIGKNRTMLLR